MLLIYKDILLWISRQKSHFESAAYANFATPAKSATSGT